MNNIFYREDENGNAQLFFADDGVAVTRLMVNGIYPVDSELSTQYEHPEGITITIDDAKKTGD